MNVRRPSDPTLATQVVGWWPSFSKARTPPRDAEADAARDAAMRAILDADKRGRP